MTDWQSVEFCYIPCAHTEHGFRVERMGDWWLVMRNQNIVAAFTSRRRARKFAGKDLKEGR